MMKARVEELTSHAAWKPGIPLMVIAFNHHDSPTGNRIQRHPGNQGHQGPLDVNHHDSPTGNLIKGHQGPLLVSR